MTVRLVFRYNNSLKAPCFESGGFIGSSSLEELSSRKVCETRGNYRVAAQRGAITETRQWGANTTHRPRAAPEAGRDNSHCVETEERFRKAAYAYQNPEFSGNEELDRPQS